MTSMTPDFPTLAKTRRSVRAYRSERVAPELLKELFDIASYAPSNCNTQPWQTHVLSGQSRDAMSQLLKKTIGEGHYQLDFPYSTDYEGIYRKRQVDYAKLLYHALGVSRDDTAGRQRAFLRNLDFFDAPHVAFIFMPQWGDVREASDVGMYAQNLMLAMKYHGIASCAQTLLSYNADAVRKQLAIDASQKLLYGISFGYEDRSKPENKIIPPREVLSESTHFYD